MSIIYVYIYIIYIYAYMNVFKYVFITIESHASGRCLCTLVLCHIGCTSWLAHVRGATPAPGDQSMVSRVLLPETRIWILVPGISYLDSVFCIHILQPTFKYVYVYFYIFPFIHVYIYTYMHSNMLRYERMTST